MFGTITTLLSNNITRTASNLYVTLLLQIRLVRLVLLLLCVERNTEYLSTFLKFLMIIFIFLKTVLVILIDRMLKLCNIIIHSQNSLF